MLLCYLGDANKCAASADLKIAIAPCREKGRQNDNNFSLLYFINDENAFFQADHALYTPGLDENRIIGDFVHDIWICYEVHCTKVLYMHLKHLLSGTRQQPEKDEKFKVKIPSKKTKLVPD